MSLQPVWPLPVVLVVAALVVVAVVVPLVRGPHRWRWAARAVAVLAAVGVLLSPAVPRYTVVERGAAVDVFFVVDRTGSMAAEDWADGAPRLDGVRHDVLALVEALPGARYSVLSWDSEATRQLPLTTDLRAVGSWTQTVRQEITAWSTGSTLDRPLDALTTTLERAQDRDPNHLRLVFLMSDGERTVEEGRRSFAELAELVDGGAVLGYGTTAGGPMREYDGSVDPDPEARYIPDPADPSRPGLSRIDEAELRALADELGVEYLHRTGPDDEVRPLVADVDAEEIARESEVKRTTWSPVVWPFAAVIAAALLVEVAVSVREWPRRRRARGGAA